MLSCAGESNRPLGVPGYLGCCLELSKDRDIAGFVSLRATKTPFQKICYRKLLRVSPLFSSSSSSASACQFLCAKKLLHPTDATFCSCKCSIHHLAQNAPRHAFPSDSIVLCRNIPNGLGDYHQHVCTVSNPSLGPKICHLHLGSVVD